MSADQYYEAGMALPRSVREEVALRLLESVDDDSIEDAWSTEISSRVDDILNGKVQTIPGEQVFAEIAARRAMRNS